MNKAHDKIIDEMIGELKTIAQRSSVATALGVVTRTRKYSGQARLSTRLGVNSQDLSVTLAPVYERNAFTGEIETARRNFNAESKNIKLGDRVFVSSNLQYAEALEFQYGDLMFTGSAENWPFDVSNVVKAL